MNFQYISPIKKSASYLDQAFRRARKRSSVPLSGEWIEKVRKKELIKIDVVTASLIVPLKKIRDDFPSFDALPEFYAELVQVTLPLNDVKRALASVKWAVERLSAFHTSYARKVSRSTRRQDIKELVHECYGRVSSVMKRLDVHLSILERARKIMRTYPDIKDMVTVCIFGFPNVGKTTLLNTLAKSTAKTAAYAFTTKGINVGYMTVKGKKIQLLDVPGTLARLEKQNLIERQAYAALNVADAVIYIFDLTEPYPLEKQEELLQRVKKQKNVFIYLSKTDVVEKNVIDEFTKKHKIYSLSELRKKLGEVRRVGEL
jgi:nucleolar GTP-binding protein